MPNDVQIEPFWDPDAKRHRWFIYRKSDDAYLHPDGKWHDSTWEKGLGHPGLYPSAEDALKTLAKFSA